MWSQQLDVPVMFITWSPICSLRCTGRLPWHFGSWNDGVDSRSMRTPRYARSRDNISRFVFKKNLSSLYTFADATFEARNIATVLK